MDLMNLKPTSDTVEVTLTHPNTVLHEQTNKRLKAMQAGKKQDFTAQDIEEATLALLSKITESWNITYGGENPKLSVAKAKELYDEVFWIKAQVEEALADSLDFTKA